MGSTRLRVAWSPEPQGTSWLIYIAGALAIGIFVMATSLYCEWPFSREQATHWISHARARIRGEIQMRLNSQNGRAKSDLNLSDQWSQVDLQFSLVESFLTEQNCKQNRKNMVACVAVINRLLDFSDIPSEFVPGPAHQWARLFGRQIEDFGFAHIRRRLSNFGSDLRIVFEQDKKRREARESEWSQMRLLNDPMPFEQVARWIRTELVDRKHESEMTAVAYNTYLSIAKDPHSQIIPMATYRALFGQNSKQFSGLGVELRRLGDNLYVNDVHDGTPAARTGLRTYDILTEVNGLSVAGLTMKDVLEEVGATDPVQFKVSRAGQELAFTIPKAKSLVVRDVVSTLLNGENGLIGYIKLTRFSTGICQAVRSSIEYFNRNEVQSLILDLRNNTGGDLGEGICLTALFLPKGTPIVRIENLMGEKQDRSYQAPEAPATTLPLYVLINARTASASEIFSGAIQEHRRGLLLGERSFGKGTTQIGRSWSRNATDPLIKKFIFLSTLGRFLLPSGYSIQIHGVQPDIEVYGSPWPTEYDKFAIREEDHLSYIEPTSPPVHRLDAVTQSRVAMCRQAQDQAIQRYDQLQKAGLLPDYPLLSVQHWARCLNHSLANIPVQSASVQ